MISQNKTNDTETSCISAEKTAAPASCPTDKTLSPELSELIEAASKLPADHLDLLVKIARRITPE